MCLILSLLGGPIAFQRGEEPILRFLSGHVNVPPSLLDAFAPNFTFPRCGAAWKDSEGNKAILKYEQNNEGEEFLGERGRTSTNFGNSGGNDHGLHATQLTEI